MYWSRVEANNFSHHPSLLAATPSAIAIAAAGAGPEQAKHGGHHEEGAWMGGWVGLDGIEFKKRSGELMNAPNTMVNRNCRLFTAMPTLIP
jgi:hypothetical protein